MTKDQTNLKKPFTVLLVEDEPGDLELMRIAFGQEGRGYDVQAVEDGEAALLFLRRQPPYTEAPQPDLVILDLNLPRKGGHEVLEEIRRDRELQGLPVIMLSTSYDDRDVRTSYRLGASSYIVKPGNFSEFKTTIRCLQDYWFATVALPRGC